MIAPAFKKDLQKDYNFLEHECVTERILGFASDYPELPQNCKTIFEHKKKVFDAKNNC